jgi:hypothetical protein
MSFDPTTLPDRLDGYEFLPAWFGSDGPDPMFATLFTIAPDILVIHSGSAGNWVAEYLHLPERKPPGTPRTHKCWDNTWRFVSAAHFAFFEGNPTKHPLRPRFVAPAPMTFVQISSLQREAPHVGGSICLGDPHPNHRSYGIEIPAAFAARDLFVAWLNDFCSAVPSIDKWTMHKVIDPQNKFDPVPGTHFDPSWMDGHGLKFVGRQA